MSKWAVIADSKLRPLNGLPIDDEVTDDIKEPSMTDHHHARTREKEQAC